jgi:KDO2-lipid IV(A) lauroyltransferase
MSSLTLPILPDSALVQVLRGAASGSLRDERRTPVSKVLNAGWWRRAATQAAVRGVVKLTRWLGPSGALGLGQAAGSLARLAVPLRRRLATNLRRAGIAPTETVLNRYFHRFGCWSGWSLAVYQAGLEGSGVAARLEFADSVAHLDRAVAKGKGVVLACPHLFCHEMAAAAIHRRHPVVALVRESKDPERGALKQHWYEATGMDTARRPRDSSVISDTLAYLRVLRSGRILGITPDVLLPAGKGLPVRMFGRQVTLSPGVVLLAMRAGAPLVTPLAEWLDAESGRRGARIRMHFSEPVEYPAGGDREHTLREGLQTWCRSVEDYLRREPENWMFWLDKRWARELAAPHAKCT